MCTKQTQRPGVTWVEFLVVFTVLALLFALLITAVARARNDALQSSCVVQLKQIILSMHTYEGPNRRLPGGKATTVGRFSLHTEIISYIDSNHFSSRVNFDIPSPTILDVAEVNGPLLSTIDSPSGTPFTLANVPETALAAGDTPAGFHRIAVFTKMTIFNCPLDMGPMGVASGNSYCPVVTSLGARDASGNVLEALWPASGGEGMNGPVPTTSPMDAEWGKRMKPPSLQGIADGSSNMLGMVERVKGWGAGGSQTPTNRTWLGPASQFLVVDQDIPNQSASSTTPGDNRTAVAACRAGMRKGTNSLKGSANNDRSGSQWFQYTCHWMGCANTMGPPNSAVCVPEDAVGDIAESGIAPASSYHRGGANCGLMDGSVRFITDEVELRILHALGTAAGEEKLTLPP